MKSISFKRIISFALCLAVLVAGIPTALMNVSAGSNVIYDNFEGTEINWQHVGATVPNANSIVTIGEGSGANKVFLPVSLGGVSLGEAHIYTYNKTLPTTKLVSVTGTIHATTINANANSSGLVIVYYYKDANNWRGFTFAGISGSQTIRFCGKENGNTNHFAYYGNYISGTLTSIQGLDTTFTITYASNGTASMVISNTTGTSAAISLLTSAKSFAGFVFSSSIVANDGQFAMANCAATDGTKDYFDNITITYVKSTADYAQDFRNTHSEILSKTTATVATGDEAAVTAALSDYAALAAEVKALLTTEKALLDDLQETLVAAKFNVSTFTEDFGGAVYWKRVDTGSTDDAATCVSGGVFKGTNVAYNSGSSALMPLYIHKYWPQGKTLDNVTLDYRVPAAYNNGAMIVYYYKDPNNWRGFWWQRGGSALNFRLHMMESDPSNPNDVYYFWQNINYLTPAKFDNDGAIPDANSDVTLKLTYAEDNSITLLTTSALGAKYTIALPSKAAYTSRVPGATFSTDVLYKSVDGGATFAAQTNSETGYSLQHTFAAITDAQASKLALSTSQAGYVDNITVNFALSSAEKANTFRTTHATILAKNVDTVEALDKALIEAAFADYQQLDSETKSVLATEYALLNAMLAKLYGNTMSGNSYTETFEGDYLWQQTGTPVEGSPIVEQTGGNHVFSPKASSLTTYAAPTVYSHRYWPTKTLTSITGTMFIGHTLTASAPSEVLIYSYKDADNWRGLVFNPYSASQSIRFVGKEDGNVVSFGYYDNYNLGTLTTIENIETTFTITYYDNGSATLRLENATGIAGGSNGAEIPLLVIEKGLSEPSFIKRINANYGAFGMGSVSNASTGDWVDNVTFNFGDTFEAKATAFRTAHAEALALDESAVTTANKALIEALYDDYKAIARDSSMAALLADEGTKTNALFNALVEAYKPAEDGAVRIACVGDSITEGFGNYSISYPKKLQDKLDAVFGTGNFTVGNFGHSGATALSYFDVSEYKGSQYFHPDIVILMLGTNDVAIQDDIFAYYYKKLANVYLSMDTVTADSFAVATSIHVYDAYNVPPSNRDVAVEERRTNVETLASANGWRLFDMYAATYPTLSSNSANLYGDTLHPNAAGYQVLADATYEYLLEGTSGTPATAVIDMKNAGFEGYSDTYALTADTVTYESIANITSALAAYQLMSSLQKSYYADEKAKLDTLKGVADLDNEVRAIVITPAAISVIGAKSDAYEALQINNTSIEAALQAKNAALNVYRPTINGATIRTVADVGKQDLRFEFSAPSGSETGWYIASYGAIFLPENMLISQNQGLTLATANIAHASNTLESGESMPAIFYANLGNSAVKDERCARNIAGTSYVVWTNGTETYTYYSNAQVDNQGYTTNTFSGIAIRSVYGVARKIANAFHGQDAVGGATVVYTAAVTKQSVLSACDNKDILAFVVANLDVIRNL